jgi:hypothetical protein
MTGPTNDPEAEKVAKLAFVRVPPYAHEEIVRILDYGANKHGSAFNWRSYPIECFLSAIERHMNKIKKGEWLDDESGFSHVSHIACSAMFLAEKGMFQPEEVDALFEKMCWHKKSPPTRGDIREGGQK